MNDRTNPDELARLKRASLQSQAKRAAWQLGGLLRRVEHEAPQVHTRLRSAVEALQVLSAQLGLELESGEVGPVPVARPAPPAAREGEFF